jgi:hypothetical protein
MTNKKVARIGNGSKSPKVLVSNEQYKDTPFQGATFNIIHRRGDPQTAELVTGQVVRREKHVYLPEAPMLNLPRLVPCIQYDNHFVYLDPVNEMGHWFAMCTCGSPAVIIEVSEYNHPQRALACYTHTGSGSHQGDSVWQ